MVRLLAACLVLMLAGTADAQRPKTDPTKFGWYTDYNAGLVEAKRSGKPMMLVFRCEP
jgi:opacity protein-like surface antigen